MDRDSEDRPERRTALIGQELRCYNIDITALSETRLAGESELTEMGSGYTFFWSGRASEESREAGVGFTVKSTFVDQLLRPPKGVSDRFMSLRLSLAYGKKHLTIISAYALTLTNPDETKHKFYEELHALITSVPKADKLVVLGDFNARIGSDNIAWDGIIGKYGIGSCNSNSLLLLQTRAEFNLSVTNTMFRLPTRNRTTWMHSRSKHWHLIDYVLVSRKDRQDVRVTKAICGAECWTDHRLVISKLNIKIKPKQRPQGTKAPKRLNISQLKTPDIKQSFMDTLTERLQSLPSEHQDLKLLGWLSGM